MLLGYSVIGLLPLQTDFRQVQVQEQITSAKFQTFDKFKNKGQRTKKKEKRAKTQVQSSELQSYWVVELLRTATANWHRASCFGQVQVSSSNTERRYTKAKNLLALNSPVYQQRRFRGLLLWDSETSSE